MDKPEFLVELGPVATDEAFAIGMAKLLEREGRTIAAAEMRRLHAENARMTAQRDALLKLLKLARSIIGHPDDAHTQMIDAVIKAVEETK